MNRNEYERIRARLEEQRRSGIALVEAAYQAQIRSVDLVWSLQGEEGGAALEEVVSAAATPQGPLPPPAVPRPRSGPEVEDDVRAALPRLPSRFTRRDVCRALGYEPERGPLYRSLQKLVAEGRARIRTQGEGNKAAVYEKAGGDGTGVHG